MALLESYFDPEQWPNQGGLLARLTALQQRPMPPQSQTLFSRVAGRDVPASTTQEASVADFGLNAPTSKGVQDGDMRIGGITSDQSIYCRTMHDLCVKQCGIKKVGFDAFGPTRACIRACMHGAGCLDF